MNKFINRNSELKNLVECYNRDEASLAIVYGRRRLGKTSLLKEFSLNRPHCYFMASRAGEKLQVNALAKAFAEKLNKPVLENIDFHNWDELFSLLDEVLPVNEKFIFIIDEFQYLCQIQPAFASIIQKWWDESWSQRNMMLILCGSITSMMYKETLAITAPLYGRSSLQLLLSPINYKFLPDFLPAVTDTVKLVEFYSISGGVPRYIELLGGFSNYKLALGALVLDKNGILFNEAKYILHEEISSPNVCWSILNALGNGKSKISALGTALSLPANQLTRYIDLLKDLFLVYREVPILEKNPLKSKKGIYKVADPFLKLWFGCIYSYESFLEFGEKSLVMNKLQPLIDQHISYCYEELCRQFLKDNMLKYDCVRIGRQWGSHYEIDIAGVNIEGKINLLGECKWSFKKLGISVLQDLQKKVIDHNLPIALHCRYILFSKSGFTNDLIQLAQKDENILLVSSLPPFRCETEITQTV